MNSVIGDYEAFFSLQLARLSELKLRPVVAFELEFYLLDPKRTADGGPQPPLSPTTGERDSATQVYAMNDMDAYARVLQDVAEACAAQDIPAAAMSSEYAPGQFEINLQHLDDPLLAADHAVLFKRAVKRTGHGGLRFNPWQRSI